MKKQIFLPLFILISLSLFAQETVRVNKIDDFIKHISSDKIIILSEGQYLISDLKYKDNKNVKISYWNNDRASISINNVKNLTIKGLGKADIILKNPVEPVLMFIDCGNINLENLELSHGPKTDGCLGAVLEFDNCRDINIDNCLLFGSGIFGISTCWKNDNKGVTNLHCSNTTIQSCSWGALNIKNSDSLYFDNCNFKDNSTHTQFTKRKFLF